MGSAAEGRAVNILHGLLCAGQYNAGCSNFPGITWHLKRLACHNVDHSEDRDNDVPATRAEFAAIESWLLLQGLGPN